MKNNSILSIKQSAFIEYLLALAQDGKDNIPPIKQIGQELGLSTPCVREQMELARNLGLIKVQPRKGISLLPYDFSPCSREEFVLRNKIKYGLFPSIFRIEESVGKIIFH